MGPAGGRQLGVGLIATRTPALSTYHEALDYLFARTTGGFKFGLERTSALLELLGRPQDRFPSIHVAGTNGKGSSVATMHALLTAKGFRVARYTSPHLIDFRERMLVAEEPIPAAEVIEFVTRYTPAVEEIGATFFEATTAMAFDYFARARADVAVIEAGLGGRLDSTNVITPLTAGVTSIGLDHTEYLGDTLEEIAAEKAGIFKAGRPAVIGEDDARLAAILVDDARRRGAMPVRVVSDELTVAHVEVAAAGTTCTLRWRGAERRLQTPLAGEHQAHNLAFALVLLDAAGAEYTVSLDEAARGLDRIWIPGRFQQLESGRLILDVAHNAAGAAVVARTLAVVAPPQPIAVVLCVLRDKDWRTMMRTLATAASHFVLTMAPTAPASRAWNLDEVLAFARDEGISAEATPDLDDALRRARARGKTVLITGSFHTVGDAMVRLQLSSLSG